MSSTSGRRELSAQEIHDLHFYLNGAFPPQSSQEPLPPLNLPLALAQIPDLFLASMAGVARNPSAAPRHNPVQAQPPRPPNAWILYRSDKLREMTQTHQPGQPKKAQALVSREISEMWKSEDPSVRAEYERLADIKKAEHASMYPGYRFQPMKKEEKARLREEKRAEKERAKEEAKRNKHTKHLPYPPQQLSPAVHSPYYNPGTPHTPYAPYGPSPPLSAASSPATTPSPLSSIGDIPQEPFAQHSTAPAVPSPLHASTSKLPESAPTRPTSRNPSYTGLILPAQHTLPSPDSVPVGSPQYIDLPSHHAWAQAPPQQQATYPTPESTAGSSTQDAGSSNPWTADAPPPQSLQDVLGTQNMVEFDVSGLDLINWQDDPSMLNASLLASGDPSVWELTGFDADTFLQAPPGEIELAMGPLPQYPPSEEQLQQQQQFAAFLERLDFSLLPGGSSLFPPTNSEAFEMLANKGQGQLQGQQGQQQEQPQDFPPHPRSFTQDNIMQFLNLDSFNDPPSQQPGQGSQSHPAPQHSQSAPAAGSSSSTSGYLPPAGAANAANRRVAGSWKPPAALYDSVPGSPVEPAAPLPWGVGAIQN